MQQLNGTISDKLRSIFKPSDKAWTPQRTTATKPMPKSGVQGVPLGKRGRK